MTNTTTTTCSVTGTVGVIVQLALAVLVLVVLILEYAWENIKYRCWQSDHDHKPRKLRTFWFDSFKICTGALVSHAFNIIVSVFVSSAADSNECAVYALAFFYEACGVPFVQLLQYGVIQYARTMSKQSDISESCKEQWEYIANPGVYKNPNRYSVSFKCESCETPGERNKKIMFGLLIAVALSLSLVAAWVFNSYESNGDSVFKLIDASVIILVFIFFTTAIVAPNASLVQTFGWVCVKIIEKTAWSLLALAQTDQFAEWSLVMSTGNSSTDAWLFIAVIPIIMNTFMFLMFSRISRLKIPCLDTKIRREIDAKRDETESNVEERQEKEHNMMLSTGYVKNDSNIDMQHGNIRSNDNSISSSISSGSNKNTSSDVNVHDNGNNSRRKLINGNNNSNSSNTNYTAKNKGANEPFMTTSDSKFDVREAIKVGIIYTLMINLTLLVIALIYLLLKDGKNVWILALTMVLAPLLIACIGIGVFQFLVDGKHNIFFCCCRNKYDQLYNNDAEAKTEMSYRIFQM